MSKVRLLFQSVVGSGLAKSCAAAMLAITTFPGPAFAELYVALPPQFNKLAAPAADVFQTPASGIYVQLLWNQIQPSAPPNSYNWKTVDRVVLPAIQNNKVLSISVISGVYTPDWLEAQGVDFVTMNIGQGGVNRKCISAKFPVVWEQSYQDAYKQMMRSLALHLKDIGALDRVRIVKVTSIGRLSAEMRLPAQVECGNDQAKIWETAGYLPSKVWNAWRASAWGLAAIFPNALITQDILEGNDFPMINDDGSPAVDAHPEIKGIQAAVKDNILRSGVKYLGGNFAIQSDCLTLDGATSAVIPAYARQGASVGWQTNLKRLPRARLRAGFYGGWPLKLQTPRYLQRQSA